MVVVLGIDPGTAHTGYGVVLSRGSKLAALDGGVIETAAGQPLERRLAQIHARVCDLIAEHSPTPWRSRSSTSARTRARAFAVGQARGVVLLAAGHGRPALLLLHAAAGQAGRVRLGPRREGPGSADGRGAAVACPTRPSPTTPPTPWRWPSATPTARRMKAALGVIASVSGEVPLRRQGEVVIETAGGVGYRLAVSAETLGAVPGAGQRGDACTRTSSCATTPCSCTASPPRPSATSS